MFDSLPHCFFVTLKSTMAEQTHHTMMENIFNLLLQNTSKNQLAEIYTMLLNQVLIMQQDAHLERKPYERSSGKNGLRNGFKPRTISSQVGKLNLAIPQVRDSEQPFKPFIPGFEQGCRIDCSFNLAIAEMYLKGVSTRKVKDILEKLCGCQVSATYVSQCTAKLDKMVEAWRNRPLAAVSHLFLDATYFKVRRDHQVVSCALLVAIGVDEATGQRSILGASCELSEASEHWGNFFSSLLARGMGRPLTVTSDSHQGLKSALDKHLTGVPWQRCQFHFQRNAMSYVARQSYKTTAASRINSVFNAEDAQAARLRAIEVTKLFRNDGQNKLADWFEENIEQCLTVSDAEPHTRKRLRTSNMMENTNKQLKRRSKVISIFPSEKSLLRLACSLLIEISEQWESPSAYSYISPDKTREFREKALNPTSSIPA